MSSDGRIGYGTKVYIADSGGTVYSAIGQVMDVPMPEVDATDVEITNQDSPGTTKEYIAGLADGSELDIEYLWTPTIEATLRALYRAKRNVRIVYPGGSDGTTVPSASTDIPRHEFVAYVKKMGGTSPVDDKMSGSFTLRICGAISLVNS